MDKMRKQMTAEEKRVKMIDTPVQKLVVSLAIPTIISMLVTSIYNMADTYFVSQIGTSASGAVGIIFSVMAILQAISFTFGMGSGNQIAIALGKKEDERASTLAATAVYSVLIIGILIAIMGNIFVEELVYLLGATETIAPYAMIYARYIVTAAPFMMTSLAMNNLLRGQGSAMYGMIGIAAGSVLNIILDPIFIYGFDMGIGGAGLATMVSQIIGCVILIYLSNNRKENISIQLRYFRPNWPMYKSILYVGSPSLCRQGLQSLSSIFLNYAAAPYGDAAIAALSIVARVTMFINSALIGFGQGFQPVCGYNIGAKRNDRVLEAFWFCVKVGTIALTLLGVIGWIFSEEIIAIFRRDDLEVIRIGSKALCLQLLLLPVQTWIIMINMLTQSIGYGIRASIVAMSRQGIFFIPLVWILPRFLGEEGLYYIQPLSDICSLILSTVIVIGIIKELRIGQNKNAKNEINIDN